jgi:hypothetical protein
MSRNETLTTGRTNWTLSNLTEDPRASVLSLEIYGEKHTTAQNKSHCMSLRSYWMCCWIVLHSNMPTMASEPR